MNNLRATARDRNRPATTAPPLPLAPPTPSGRGDGGEAAAVPMGAVPDLLASGLYPRSRVEPGTARHSLNGSDQ